MDNFKEWVIGGVITVLVGVVGFFSNSKISTIDKRLDRLEKWQGFMNVHHGEFIQLQNQIKDMREDQKLVLSIVSELKSSMLRRSNEERRHHLDI